MHDTLMYVKKLEAVGIPRAQAEVQVEIMSNFVDSNFATKYDLEKGLAEVRSEMQIVSRDIVIKLAAIIVATSTIMLTVIGMLLKA